MKYIQLIIISSLLFTSKNYSQEFTNNYVDSIDGFSLSVPNDFRVEKIKKTNLSNIYDENNRIFATIHLLHLSDLYQKYELKDKDKYHEMVTVKINEMMNTFDIRTVESEIDNNLDSLVEDQTSKGINYFIAYHHKKYVLYGSDKTEIYFVQPYYFAELLKNDDVLILLFKYMDDEINKKGFILNVKKQELMLKIIDSVTLYIN
jgi:hypothetical protein